MQTRNDPEGSFALAALMEVPSQLTAMLELGYFNNEGEDVFVGVENRPPVLSQSNKKYSREDSFSLKKQSFDSIHNRNSSNNLRVN